jgi:hypothetical protein
MGLLAHNKVISKEPSSYIYTAVLKAMTLQLEMMQLVVFFLVQNFAKMCKINILKGIFCQNIPIFLKTMVKI